MNRVKFKWETATHEKCGRGVLPEPDVEPLLDPAVLLAEGDEGREEALHLGELEVGLALRVGGHLGGVARLRGHVQHQLENKGQT